MHNLELQVDENIQDAIIHAESTIKDMQAEVATVNRLLSENASLLERVLAATNHADLLKK